MSLTQEKMSGILDRIRHHIETKFFNPLADVTLWTNAWPGKRDWVLATDLRR